VAFRPHLAEGLAKKIRVVKKQKPAAEIPVQRASWGLVKVSKVPEMDSKYGLAYSVGGHYTLHWLSLCERRVKV